MVTRKVIFSGVISKISDVWLCSPLLRVVLLVKIYTMVYVAVHCLPLILFRAALFFSGANHLVGRQRRFGRTYVTTLQA